MVRRYRVTVVGAHPETAMPAGPYSRLLMNPGKGPGAKVDPFRLLPVEYV